MHTIAQKCGMAASLPNPSLSISYLPTEIWIQIVEHLCVHCRAPSHAHGIPDFRTAGARAGKATLKALCLVSRAFRAMSQEILFHCFLNLSRGGELGGPAVINDRTPSFLRALLLNPSLGRHVRMMSLFRHSFLCLNADKPDIKREDLEVWTRVSASYHVRVPIEVTRALEGQPRDNAPRLFFDEPGPCAQIRLSHGKAASWVATRTMEQVLRWLHVLILNFVPHLTHLQLTEPLGSMEEFQNTPPVLSQLREMSYNKYKLEDLIESHALYPNLHSLGVPDFFVDQPRQISCPLPAMNLRKLSITCLPADLSLMLRLCPYLEDLECHVRPGRRSMTQDTEVQWPAHTKSNLRRLAWSNQEYIGDLDDNPGLVSAITVPLQEFDCLEILEIDQLSLLMYSKSLGAKTLSSVLPESLRILHTAFSRDSLSQLQIARQLREIAGARAMDLPNLSIVKVGEPPSWGAESKKLGHFLQRTGILNVMRGAGIELRIGKEAPKKSCDRSLLSQPPGAALKNCGPTFQDEVFSLGAI